MKEKNYRIKFVIEDDENVILTGSTFIISNAINEYGECESVDMELGRILRVLKKKVSTDSLDHLFPNVMEDLDEITPLDK